MMSMMKRRTILPFLLALSLLAALAALVYWQPAPAAAQQDASDKPASPQNLQVITQLSSRPYYVEDRKYREDRENNVMVEYKVQRLVCPSTVVVARWPAVTSDAGPVSYVAEYRRTDRDLGENVWTGWTDRGFHEFRGRPLLRIIRHIHFGETYEVRVAAVVDGVMGDYATARVNADSDALQAPQELSVASYDQLDGAMRLTWKNPGEHSWALVGRRASGDLAWTEENRVLFEPAHPSVLVTGLTGGVEYDFRVIHVNEQCLNSKPSNVATALVPQVGPPAAPEFGAVVEYGDGGPVIRVTPDDVSGSLTGYTLRYRLSGSSGDYSVVSATREEADRGISTGALSYGSVYEVGLRASNRYGDGEYAEREVAVSALPQPPAFTVAPDYREDGAFLVIKVTDGVSGATSYVVRINDQDTSVTPEQVSGEGLIVPAELGTEYAVAVASANAVGQGKFSPAQSLTTLSLPSKPDAAAEVEYSGDGASIVVSVAAPDAAEAVVGYAVSHRRSDAEGAQRVGNFLTPTQAQAGHSIDAELGASYEIEVVAVNDAGSGPSATLNVRVKEKAGTPDFTAEAVYADGAATVVVTVTNAAEDVTGYSVRRRSSASEPWTVTDVSVADAGAGWSFEAEPGTGYSVGVAARTEVGLGDYGSATVSIVPRVGEPTFTVAVANGDNGPVVRVSVDSPGQHAKYHLFTMDDAAPVKAVMPDVAHEFSVALGSTYRIGVAAGNELGTGEYAYQDVLAVVVPQAPTFTLAPTWRQGVSHLAVSVANPDPHASHYLLQVGSGEPVRHTRDEIVAGLAVPVEPGQTYTVSLAAGNVAGDSPHAEVTRTTTTAEFEALLGWRLVLPDELSPAEAVGAATQYVAIVNGGPVRYDPQPGCVGRETARAEADFARALALSGWVSAMSSPAQGLISYARQHESSVSDALTASRSEAAATCASRYPTVENLGLADARWHRVLR